MSLPDKTSPDESTHHSSTDAKLIYMANQIGKFFASQAKDKAAHGIAEHIRKFWDPRMRNKIYAHLDSGGEGLDPPVFEAITQLKAADAKHEAKH